MIDSPTSSEQRAGEQEEMGGPARCFACERELAGSYWEVDGQTACEACRYAAEGAGEEGGRLRRFAGALGLGAAGAAVGAGIYYAVLSLSGYEVGIIAILVGFMVGGGVRRGSRRRGGWLYQGMAVMLTYGAIVSTYVPMIVQEVGGFEEAALEPTAVEPADGEGIAAVAEDPAAALAAGPALPPEEAEVGLADDNAAELEAVLTEAGGGLMLREEGGQVDVVPVGFGGWLIGALLLVAFAAALPFLAGFENLVGLAIIGFALYQAWQLNRRHRVEIAGPFRVGEPRSEALPPVGS